MAHLSRDTLIAWRDHPTDRDRAVVVAHLASCAACAATYAELVRVQPQSDAPRAFDPEAFKARGLAARAPVRRPFHLPRWLLVPAAAAAVVVLAVMIVRPDRDDAPVMRGGAALQATAPAGDVQAVSGFTWEAPADAELFRIEIMDPSGALVHDARVRGRHYALPSDVAARFARGVEYRWIVSRIDARGETLETSPSVAFTLR